MTEIERLGRAVREPLVDLKGVLERIDRERYVRSRSGVSTSPGAQVRHILDLVDRLLDGWERGEVDYDRRQRDEATERDPRLARERLEALIEGLREATGAAQDASLRVRSDEPHADTPWASSSRARELRFVLSHTVHHCAILGLLLENEGFALSEGFGLAPATRVHRERTLGIPPAAFGRS